MGPERQDDDGLVCNLVMNMGMGQMQRSVRKRAVVGIE